MLTTRLSESHLHAGCWPAPDGDSADQNDGSRGERPELDISQAPGVTAAIDLAWIRAGLGKALALVGQASHRPIKQVTVRIVDDERMLQMNRRFAGENHTTDVLSFDLSNGDAINADIAICADEAGRRARDLGHSIERELLLYAVHGLLHCAGFNDHNDADFARMHAEEDRILDMIGVGATFVREAREAGDDRSRGGSP